jgi:hypothetical protein
MYTVNLQRFYKNLKTPSTLPQGQIFTTNVLIAHLNLVRQTLQDAKKICLIQHNIRAATVRNIIVLLGSVMTSR